MYGEEHYECAHARNNPPTSRVLSQLNHSLYTSRKEPKRAFSTTGEMFGSEGNDHESDRFLPVGPQAGGLVGTSIPVRPNLRCLICCPCVKQNSHYLDFEKQASRAFRTQAKTGRGS